ncbi:hypothetical protein B0T16DRAFT_390264 [Cercophora newfieldiana]|uniref:RecA family profile 1 domain-containing protein n=1 Tax=Cercophora newfieldiana TaxID=92897 RepID=A0AA40CQA9_9PEZI|nr:hypothetical protein B0T16DRAFT_390264 [Cercophora newfieldiana]
MPSHSAFHSTQGSFFGSFDPNPTTLAWSAQVGGLGSIIPDDDLLALGKFHRLGQVCGEKVAYGDERVRVRLDRLRRESWVSGPGDIGAARRKSATARAPPITCLQKQKPRDEIPGDDLAPFSREGVPLLLAKPTRQGTADPGLGKTIRSSIPDQGKAARQGGVASAPTASSTCLNRSFAASIALLVRGEGLQFGDGVAGWRHLWAVRALSELWGRSTWGAEDPHVDLDWGLGARFVAHSGLFRVKLKVIHEGEGPGASDAIPTIAAPMSQALDSVCAGRHGHDISSFDLPSTHRLPTVSAAQALEEFHGNETNFVPTGLPALDAALGLSLDDERNHGGIQKGQVTEIWGPPGVGKTTLGSPPTVCAKAEQLYGFHPVSSERLRTVVTSASEDNDKVTASRLEAFTHYTCPSLPHFIALLCRPTTSCVAPNTDLIVIDSLSALLNHAFPKAPDGRAAGDSRGIKGPPLTDLAIVVLTQCATKMQAERGATLIPAINAAAWDQGISTRLVLFRDWAPEGTESRAPHFVGVQRKNGRGNSGSLDDVTAFSIKPGDLVSVDCDSTQTSRGLSSTPAPKRKLADTNFEIADSDDEDYGWQDEEPLLPPMPSQWKGSEDVLLEPRSNSDEETLHEDEESVVESLTDEQDREPTVNGTISDLDRPQNGP